VGNALAGRILVIAAVDDVREIAVDGARGIVVESARVEGMCPLWAVVLDGMRVIDFEVVTLLVGLGRVEPGRETASRPVLKREVAATVDAVRLVFSGRIVFNDEGTRATLGSGIGAGLARENGLSSTDHTQQK
jgi:hypothetical protein